MPRVDVDEEFPEEDPDESEMDPDIGDENDEYTPCFYCKKMIYEQAEQCPHCGKYQSEEDSPTQTPLWIILTVIICGIIILFWIFR